MKKINIILLIILFLFFVSGCENKKTNESLISTKINNKSRTLPIANTTKIKITDENITSSSKNTIVSTTKKVREYEALDDFNFLSYESVNYYGRCYLEKINDENAVFFNNSASSFEFNFKGKEVTIKLYSKCYLTGQKSYIKVFLDDDEGKVIEIDDGINDYTILNNLDEQIHTVKVMKITQDQYSSMAFLGIKNENELKFYKPNKKSELKLEFYGDSLTCAHGCLGTGDNYLTKEEDSSLSHAVVCANLLEAQVSICSCSAVGVYMDTWGIGFTMNDIYNKYSQSKDVVWKTSIYEPDIICVNLGTNDYSGLFDKTKINEEYRDEAIEEFIQAYYNFFMKLYLLNPNATFIMTYNLAPSSPTMVKAYKDTFNLVKNSIEKSYMVELPSNTGGAQAHPTKEAQKVAGEVLAKFIKENIL